MESVRAKHVAELEEKRRKLEEIRKRKANVRATEDVSSVDAATKATIDQQETKFDDFIQNILKTTGGGESDGAAKLAKSVEGEIAAASGPPALSLAEKLASLSTVSNVAELHIQPILVETYTKHTQTDIALEHDIVLKSEGTDPLSDETVSRSPLKPQISADVKSLSSSPTKLAIETSTSVETDAVKLSEDDKKRILESDEMETFLTKASRVIERALTSSSKFDIMVDYGAIVEEDTLMEETSESLKQQFVFADSKWSKHRAVTDIDMSPFFPELMLVAYSARDFLDDEESDAVGSRQWDTMENSVGGASSTPIDMSTITEGVVLMWSTALPTRPEYRFTCHSQVTSACFNPFDRHLIIGGTYSGQIVIWDTRAKSAPVRKTSLSSSSHTHPIYAMAIVGSKSEYHLVSASTDGRVCIWDIDQLQQPVDMMDLRIELSIVSNYSSATKLPADKRMEASVTSFAILRKEVQELFIGTEAGKIYSAKLEQQKGQTAAHGAGANDGADVASEKTIKNGTAVDAIAAREVIVKNAASSDEAHFGPVTAMHLNPLLMARRDGLLITSSLDSSVKLWSTDHPQVPILSFEPSSEYVCDVRWSPVHPSLFAVADGSGAVSVWNILKDTEVPVISVSAGKRALTKIRWSADGLNVIVGDDIGTTLVFEVPSEIALPVADDLAQLESKVANAVASALTKP